MLRLTHLKIHESRHRSCVNTRMLTGQQWSSKIPTRHGTRTSTDRQCKSKGGQAMKLQTSLPPLHFLLQICTNYKNDQIDHVKSGNPLKSGKFSSLMYPLLHSSESTPNSPHRFL